MKTYPFIVINKNNMKEMKHYATSSAVGRYLFERSLENIIIIINERHIIHLKDLDTRDVNQIERMLHRIQIDNLV